MKITREFAPASRYLYDFGKCSYANGWFQVDTPQDAEYFGTWIHPEKLLHFNYCEGDTTLVEFESAAEMAKYLEEGRDWNEGELWIDPGLSADGRARLEAAGLRDFIAAAVVGL